VSWIAACRKLAIAATALPALQGCTTIDLAQAGSRTQAQTRERIFLGVVAVRLPKTNGKIAAIDVKTLGAGWQSGPFIGWNASNLVTANPADCQLLVVIRSPAQAENAAKVISSLEGQNPCIVDYTSN
jgi:hypothetical protein